MAQGPRTSPDRRSPLFRVVIIDDDVLLRRVVSIACAATAGLEVVGEAQDGEEGLALCERVAPDLVVLDLTLPGMGGLEVTTRLRESRSPSRVLMFTAREDGETVLAAMRSGVHGFLAKSAAIDDVASAMLAVARGEPIFPPEHERAAVQELGRLARAARTGARMGSTLTSREITILQLLAEGLTLRQVGTRLGISHRTVESHVTKLYRKLEVTTRVQAMAQAASLGVIELGRVR
jgi:DNA-binding NarL/FixJ family response regulator